MPTGHAPRRRSRHHDPCPPPLGPCRTLPSRRRAARSTVRASPRTVQAVVVRKHARPLAPRAQLDARSRSESARSAASSHCCGSRSPPSSRQNAIAKRSPRRRAPAASTASASRNRWRRASEGPEPRSTRLAVQRVGKGQERATPITANFEQALVFQTLDCGVRHEREQDSEGDRLADGDDLEGAVLVLVITLQSGVDQIEQLRAGSPFASHGPAHGLAAERTGPTSVLDQLAEEQRPARTPFVERMGGARVHRPTQDVSEHGRDIARAERLELENGCPFVPAERREHWRPHLSTSSTDDGNGARQAQLMHDRGRFRVEKMHVVDEDDRSRVTVTAQQRTTGVRGERGGLGADGLSRKELRDRAERDVLHEWTADDPPHRMPRPFSARGDLAQQPGLANTGLAEDDDRTRPAWPDRAADDFQLLVAPPERPRPDARAGRPPLVHPPSVGNGGPEPVVHYACASGTAGARSPPWPRTPPIEVSRRSMGGR